MYNFCFIKEQLESAQREIAMGNERERQLQSKLLKTKEELKLEREEVNTCTYNLWNGFKCSKDHEIPVYPGSRGPFI